MGVVMTGYNPTKTSRDASSRSNDLLSYGSGIAAVIFALGPAFRASNDWFVNYVTNYYGSGFAWFASIFLFLLLAILIFSAASLMIHTVSKIIQGRATILGLIFKR
jgi:hypothetical protein